MTSHPDVELDWDELADDFAAFHARFADLFAREEPRRRVKAYLRGLLGGAERRNGWQLAEALGETNPQGVQRLLRTANWSAQTARDRLVTFCAETFGDPEGIAILDDTGFLKKGDQSAGVARQYTGTAGKIENAQVGVFLGYVSRHGHVMVDRGLYLPREWTEDPDRCRAAGIPAHVRFRTKPTLARRMLHRAVRLGLPVKWVTADEGYGDNPALRHWLSQQPYRYVVAVSRATRVWTTPPTVATPTWSGRGRPPTRAVATPPPVRVDALVATWPAERWTRWVAFQGEKGPIEYDWACARVFPEENDLPGAEAWLLVRRSVSNPTEHAYYLSDAPDDTPLTTLTRVAASRYTIEQLLEEAKDDVGMDHYEVRTWTGWYRHVTLCLMALAWVASVRQQLAARAAKKGGPATARRSRSHRGPSPRPAASCA